MASTYRLLLDDAPAGDDVYAALTALEVEEHVELPGAVQLTLGVNRGRGGDLTFVNDKRFTPYARVSVVATPEGKGAQCIFDGYVLAHRLHVRTGTTDSTLAVWGQDASCLMNVEEKVREWINVTDGVVANTIFGEYGFAPAAANISDDSPTHTEQGHTLVQRATDIQFLRALARRNGKLCRIACADAPATGVGYFAKPDLTGPPAVTLRLNPPLDWTVDALDVEWDVARPTTVRARQAVSAAGQPDGIGGDTTDSGLRALDARDLAAFAKKPGTLPAGAQKPTTTLLTTVLDDQRELTLRGQSLLREAGWFVRCEGEVNVSRIQTVLRAGTLARIDGTGSLHSGDYYVWSVRHRITTDAHTMRFVLVRNAVGPGPS